MKNNLVEFVKSEALYPSIQGMIEMVKKVACCPAFPVNALYMRRINELMPKAPEVPAYWFMPSYGETYEQYEASRLPDDCQPDFIKEINPGETMINEQRAYNDRLITAKESILSDWDMERELKWPWFWACTMALGPFWGVETCASQE